MQGKSTSKRASRAALIGSTAVLVGLAAAPQAHAQAAAAAPTANEVVVTGSRIARRDFTSESPIVTVTGQTLTNTSDISIDQTLNNLPQFVPGANQVTSAGDVQSTPTNSPGVSLVNLRGLGTNRTLVLLDGRRTQPNNASLAVDLNTIPTLAVDSVEIITGGAAATYGADAVAGVVNFKLKHNYQGVTLDAQWGETFYSDGAQTRIAALVGGNFADNRGNAMVGLTYENRGTVLMANRQFFRNAWIDPGTPAADFFPNFPGFNIIPYTGFVGPVPNIPTQAAVNSIFTPLGFAPGDVSNAAGIYFNRAATTSASTLFSVNHGAVSGLPAPGYTGGFYPNYKLLTNGDLGSNATNGFLSLPLQRYSIFANGHYDINENATFYVQGSLDWNDTQTALGGHVPAVNQWGVSIPYDSATDGAASGHLVSPELATLLNSRPDPNAPWQLNQELDFLGPRSLDTRTNTYQILGGIKGNVGFRDWTYDLYGSHGNTDQLVAYSGFADQARYQALIALPDWGAGADFNNGLTGLLAHCTSGLNPFTTAPVSRDCINIVSANIKTSSNLQQDQVELDFQGSLAKVPAGDLRFALGADYRSDFFQYLPDPAMSTTNITSATLGIFDAAPASGTERVYEAYVEFLAPLLKDYTLVKNLNLDAGYRFSSYDTGAGGVSTWKVTADWDINDWVKIRGGYSVANRAPNVAELFEPSTVVVNSWPDSDPCANTTIAPYGNIASNPNRAQALALCTALSHGFPITPSFAGQVPTYFPLSLDQQLGNANLKSETARTWTIGTVLKSPFQEAYLKRMTLSVDYYNINIAGAIAPLTSQIIYQECLNGFGTNPSYDPSNPYCQLIIRSPAGFTSTVLGKFANLGSIATSGIDVQFDWSADAPSFNNLPATVFANIQFNWLQAYDVQTVAGGPVIHYANTIGQSIFNPPYGAQFRWKLFMTVGYNLGPATLSLNWRHLPEVNNFAVATNPASTALPSPSYDEFDLSGRWAITSKWEVRAGIDNLTNIQPLIVGAIPGVTNAAGLTDPAGSYDEVGRRFYVGIRAKF
jgi:iron complex outermembrane recepter protein